MRRLLPLALAPLLYGACAPMLGHTRDPVYVGNGPGAMSLPPLTVYQDSSGPLSYRAAVAKGDGPREVRGDACQSGLMLPVGLVSAMQLIGRDDLLPADAYADAYAEEPPPTDEGGFEGLDGPTEDGYPPEEVHSPPEDEDMRG